MVPKKKTPHLTDQKDTSSHPQYVTPLTAALYTETECSGSRCRQSGVYTKGGYSRGVAGPRLPTSPRTTNTTPPTSSHIIITSQQHQKNSLKWQLLRHIKNSYNFPESLPEEPMFLEYIIPPAATTLSLLRHWGGV